MQQTVPGIWSILHPLDIIVICMQFNSIHRLMNVQHECFRHLNTLNWNAICICNMQCSHRKFKWSSNQPPRLNMCTIRILAVIQFHLHMDDLWNCSECTNRWKEQRLEAQSNEPKFEWIRLEWHCFINPIWISIDIYDSIAIFSCSH